LVTQGFSPQKLRILGAGINLSSVSHATSKEKKPKFQGIFIGRLHHTKGIFDLIPIWHYVCKRLPYAKLGIIGPDTVNIKRELQNQIFKSKLQNRIKVLGEVTDQQKLEILGSSQIFLFTDHEAGWGIAAAEAMACGLPVVGYDIGVLGSVFTDGFLISPLGDYSNFANNIVSLLRSPSRYNRFSFQALNQAKNLDWSITSKKFKIILDEISN
jgi:glycosyltransferase involved in cell wall biosynthesis